jgi:hypothetical protein
MCKRKKEKRKITRGSAGKTRAITRAQLILSKKTLKKSLSSFVLSLLAVDII